MLFDEDCVELIGDAYISRFQGNVSINMDNPPDGRLIISPNGNNEYASKTRKLIIKPLLIFVFSIFEWYIYYSIYFDICQAIFQNFV